MTSILDQLKAKYAKVTLELIQIDAQIKKAHAARNRIRGYRSGYEEENVFPTLETKRREIRTQLYAISGQIYDEKAKLAGWVKLRDDLWVYEEDDCYIVSAVPDPLDEPALYLSDSDVSALADMLREKGAL